MTHHSNPQQQADRRERRERDKAETLRRRHMRAMKYGATASAR